MQCLHHNNGHYYFNQFVNNRVDIGFIVDAAGQLISFDGELHNTCGWLPIDYKDLPKEVVLSYYRNRSKFIKEHSLMETQQQEIKEATIINNEPLKWRLFSVFNYPNKINKASLGRVANASLHVLAKNAKQAITFYEIRINNKGVKA